MSFACTCAFPVPGGQCVVSGNEAAAIVERHNYYRQTTQLRTPPAVELGKLSWDANLASNAQAYAQSCTSCCTELKHSSLSSRSAIQSSCGMGTFAVLGENLARGVGLKGVEAVDLLVAGSATIPNEREAYNAVTNSCSIGTDSCGHYTQIIWNTTTSVGCGCSMCGNARLWVCQYGPSGNIAGSLPYSPCAVNPQYLCPPPIPAASATCATLKPPSAPIQINTSIVKSMDTPPSYTLPDSNAAVLPAKLETAQSPTVPVTPIEPPAPAPGGSSGKALVGVMCATLVLSVAYIAVCVLILRRKKATDTRIRSAPNKPIGPAAYITDGLPPIPYGMRTLPSGDDSSVDDRDFNFRYEPPMFNPFPFGKGAITPPPLPMHEYAGIAR